MEVKKNMRFSSEPPSRLGEYKKKHRSRGTDYKNCGTCFLFLKQKPVEINSC